MGKSKDLATGASYVDTSGDTMTGNLTVSGGLVSATGTSTETNTESDIGLYHSLKNLSSDVNTGVALAFGSNNNSGAIIYGQRTGSNNEHKMGFQTRNNSGSAATRMAIDGSGRVTKPYQPAFKAYAGGGWQSFGNTNNNLMPFDTASPNVGNHYSTSTKRFTAPVAGTYFFYGQWYGDGNSYSEMLLRKNGSAEVAYGNVRDQGAVPKTSVILSLSANDYVEMFGKISNTDNQDWYAFTSYSFFCGYLLG